MLGARTFNSLLKAVSYIGMHNSPRPHKIISYLLWAVLAASSVGTYYIVSALNDSAKEYSNIQTELNKPANSGSVEVVQLPGSDKKLNVPTWSLFQTGNIWTLISKAKPVSQDFTPNDLVDVPISHGDAGTPMKVSLKIADPLKKMAAAASSDGVVLAVSSGYRSAKDQQQILDQFIAVQGESVARQYVALPGNSEHQSGLAVDISDDTPQCRANSDDCSLSFESAQWLANNAYKYGFIQRYPAGTSAITGVATERWHYRYVGSALARVMHDSDLTFDQFVELAR
jgi:D-alanyl-D-alanine carboxypeptidase